MLINFSSFTSCLLGWRKRRKIDQHKWQWIYMNLYILVFQHRQHCRHWPRCWNTKMSKQILSLKYYNTQQYVGVALKGKHSSTKQNLQILWFHIILYWVYHFNCVVFTLINCRVVFRHGSGFYRQTETVDIPTFYTGYCVSHYSSQRLEGSLWCWWYV